jgi:hypothetical protein
MYAPFFDERDARELQGAQSDPLQSRQENWVRFAKTAAPVLTASTLAASEGAHRARHRSRQ